MGKIHILIQGTIYMNFCFKTRNWANQVVVDLAKQIMPRYEMLKKNLTWRYVLPSSVKSWKGAEFCPVMFEMSSQPFLIINHLVEMRWGSSTLWLVLHQRFISLPCHHLNGGENTYWWHRSTVTRWNHDAGTEKKI